MIFKLYESVPYINDEYKEKWQHADDVTRDKMTSEIVSRYNRDSLKNIEPAIRDNFDYFGIDETENPYMKFLDELEFSPKETYLTNFNLLNRYLEAGKVNLDHDYLRWESLYNRPNIDFDYTLNAFEIVMDKEELSQYFNDITNISADQLVDPETNEILPAGHEGDKGIDTIYGVIDQWTTDDRGRSNVPEEENDEYKYTLNNALKHFKVPNTQYANVVKKWVETYYTAAKRYVNPDVQDVSYYATKAYNILTTDKVKLTQKDKNDIMNKHHYATPQDVPAKEKTSGNIIYIREKEHSTSPRESDMINNFVVYSDGQWVPYDEYVINIKQDKKTELLNSKTIKVVNDKGEITAGVIRAIDKLSKDEELQSDISNYI